MLHCESKRIQLEDLSLAELKTYSELIEEDVYKALSLENSIESRSVVGGTASSRVMEALAEAEKRLAIVE